MKRILGKLLTEGNHMKGYFTAAFILIIAVRHGRFARDPSGWSMWKISKYLVRCSWKTLDEGLERPINHHLGPLLRRIDFQISRLALSAQVLRTSKHRLSWLKFPGAFLTDNCTATIRRNNQLTKSIQIIATSHSKTVRNSI